MLAPLAVSVDQLYEEIVARVKQDDSSVPFRFHGYWYATRYVAGRQYPLIVRWPDAHPNTETILLDCNELAEGQSFFDLGTYEVSPDNRLLAYTVDLVGRRQYGLWVRDIGTGQVLDDGVTNIEPGVAWANDNRTLLYVEKDPVTLLGRRVRRHSLGTDATRDPLVYEESDESFDLAVARSRSEECLFIAAESTTTSEWRYVSADRPEDEFELFLPRRHDHEYQIEHFAGRFLVRSNLDAENFSIRAATPDVISEPSRWFEVVPHRTDVFIHGFEVFTTFLAVSERSGGLRKLRLQRTGEAPQYLPADDATYTMTLGANPEPTATRLRYVYTSLTTPATTYEYDLATGKRTQLKREPVIGDFDPVNYTSDFIWVTARDGQHVPVSIVRHVSTPLDGRAPLYLYGYGAYGVCIEPGFSSARLSLLDRGLVYAIAHIRGGQEVGRRWYDSGRLLAKWNTFHDFIDVTDHLVAQGYGAPDRVVAAGGSAGGLLVGVIMNAVPQKYAGIVAHVPFVDIVTTMLDETIPLTTLEYEEWGDPRMRVYYEYMLSYSPYDNVSRQDYPALLATTGLWDSQVQYFEPAKWVAKLRAATTGSAPLLLHVNLDAGHGGKSGRYERLYEVAREYAFVIGLMLERAWGPGCRARANEDRQQAKGALTGVDRTDS